LAGSNSVGLWVDLDWLLGLPLEGPALGTLWAAVRDQLAADPVPSAQSEAARAALEQALARQDLFNLRRRCLGGDWFAGLDELQALLAEDPKDLKTAELAARVGAELVLELHHRLIDDDAPPCPYDGDQRAELLWRAHALLGHLEPLPGPRPVRLPVVIEQISRYGALAWMERDGSPARRRAVELLLRLCAVNPEARSWALPAIRERVSAEAQEQARAPDPADTEGLALLLNWIEGLAVVDPPADQALEALRQALLRGRLSLELLQAGGG